SSTPDRCSARRKRSADLRSGATRRAPAGCSLRTSTRECFRGRGRRGVVGVGTSAGRSPTCPVDANLEGVSAAGTKLGGDAVTPAPGGGDVEEDEEVEDGQPPAVHVGDPVPLREGPMEVELEEGNGHLARGDEGRGAGEEAEGDEDPAGKLDDAPYPPLG